MKSSKIFTVVTKQIIRFGTKYKTYQIRATSISNARKLIKQFPTYGTEKCYENSYYVNERISEVFESGEKEQENEKLKNIGDTCLMNEECDENLKYARR